MGALSWFTSFKRAFITTKRHHHDKKREKSRWLLAKSPNNIHQTQPLIEKTSSSNYVSEAYQCKNSISIKQHFSAILIQTAFRGYLARRAARALKGIVMLQAMIRGQIARSQAAITFTFMHAPHHVQTRKEANQSRNINKLQVRANWLVQWIEAKQQARSNYRFSVGQEFTSPYPIKIKSLRCSAYSNDMETPNYMTPTESARAKTRSKNSPRLAPLTPDQKERVVSVKKQLSYKDQYL